MRTFCDFCETYHGDQDDCADDPALDAPTDLESKIAALLKEADAVDEAETAKP